MWPWAEHLPIHRVGIRGQQPSQEWCFLPHLHTHGANGDQNRAFRGTCPLRSLSELPTSPTFLCQCGMPASNDSLHSWQGRLGGGGWGHGLGWAGLGWGVGHPMPCHVPRQPPPHSSPVASSPHMPPSSSRALVTSVTPAFHLPAPAGKPCAPASRKREKRRQWRGEGEQPEQTHGMGMTHGLFHL